MAKVSRWIKQLSDTEVVLLTHRLLRTLSKTAEVDPVALRTAFLQFVEDHPQQRLERLHEKEVVG